MKIDTLGFVSVNDAPAGSLIAYPDGCMVMVSEYSTTIENEPYIKRDAYIVGSGEYFCGDRDAKGMLIEIDTNYTPEEPGDE